MTSFKDIPNILEQTTPAKTTTTEEAAFNLRPMRQDDGGMERVVVRVFGQPGKPVLADLNSRSVYPVKV